MKKLKFLFALIIFISCSNADFRRLQSVVFPSYNITCTYSTYNVSELYKSLQENMPVIISAFAYLPNINTTRVSFNSQGNKKEGHSFIADRYKREHQITENVYEWVYDSPSGLEVLLPYVKNKHEYVYSSPEITMIGFNWGWGDIDNSDGKQWFTLTGDWIRINYVENWNINKSMIYNFKAKQ